MAYGVAAGVLMAILAVHMQYSTSQTTGCNESAVRLIDGENEFEGRVELCMRGEWGTVCSISSLFWGPRDAEVVCRQLGKLADSPPITSFFGEGVGPIHLSEVHCNGSEQKLIDCQTGNEVIGLNSCDHGDDVGVICQVPDPQCGSGDVRLMNSNVTSLLAGRVEVCISGVWGTVCNDEWDQRDAEVVCRQLRSTSSYAFAVVNNVEFGAGMGPILLDEVECTGSELNLTECTHRGVNVHNCNLDHSEDAAVICSVAVPECSDTDVRLVHGGSPREGVVEICFGGRWGSVCNRAWDRADAAVVCGQLGFSREGAQSVALLAWQIFGEGSRPYMFSQVNCSGSEETLDECQNGGVNVHDCRSFQEAGVICGTVNPTTVISRNETGTDISSDTSTVLATVLPISVVLIVLVIVGVFTVVCLRQKRRTLKQNQMKKTRVASGLIKCVEMVTPSSSKQSVHHANLQKLASYRPSLNLRRILPHRMIIPSSMLHLQSLVGQGEFGVVYKACLQWHHDGAAEFVAVKTLRGLFTPNDVDSLVQEVLKMHTLNHPNVMSLTGVCLDSGGGPAVVMPYMDNGSVLHYLRKETKELVPPNDSDSGMVSHVQTHLLGICLQISKGMEYLAKEKIVHRDLAARNCMMDANGVIKVGDFGFSEKIYTSNYYRQKKSDTDVKFPVRWMAPESIRVGVFTEKSDVWSYGVTCWEVFTGGQIPYSGISPVALLQLLCNGERLNKPMNPACSDEIYAIVQECWMEEPHKRPDFSKLVVTISLTLEALAGYMSLNTTSLIIVNANKVEHQVATVAKKADISATSLDLASPEKDEHPFVPEEVKACDPGMEAQSKEKVEQETVN